MKKSIPFMVLILVFITCIACSETPETWIKKGNEAYETGNYDEAIKCYKKASAIDPNYEEAHKKIAFIYSNQSKLDEAISEYKKAIAIDPNDTDTHSLLAYEYYKKGLNSLAADHYYKAGLLYLKKGDKNNALMQYELLKKMSSKKLAQKLFEKLYPEKKQKKDEI